ncbi:MAG: M23 family metallopeptidase [Chloroflexi bacterium]|nr:M23 family metallopeptidase [Chloroflexota bacterium]
MIQTPQYPLRPLLWLLALLTITACRPAIAASNTPPASSPIPTAYPPTATHHSPPATAYPPPATLTPPATPTTAPTAVATATPVPPPPTFANPPDDNLGQTAVAFNAELIRPEPTNTGLWQYTADSFIHPLALVVGMGQDVAYLLDGGRVLALNLAQPAPPEIVLAPGDVVEGVTVLEPLDLFAAPDGLLALDRAGDVYRRDWGSQTWALDRYDRPISDKSSHYYVALDGAANGRYLLETSYDYVLLYANGAQQALWVLPEERGVDLVASGGSVYVLLQAMDTESGSLRLYRDTASVTSFRPPAIIHQPRQVLADETAVYVLDENGRRLLVLAADSGRLLQLWQMPTAVSAIGLTPQGDLLLAGRDRLYFANQPQQLAAIGGGTPLSGAQPHDPDFLAGIDGFVSPIGPNLAARDLQMPGAPRHYRLGVHQGADFYWRLDSPVYAAADGTVIRATLDYAPPFPADFFAWQTESQQLGYTSEAGLDFYRGRQVWIEHTGGLVSRYIHLNSIAYGIQEGQPIAQGQLLGTVGNSGSPASLESAEADAHLHFELWLGDHYVGQYLRPVETRYWLERILLGK